MPERAGWQVEPVIYIPGASYDVVDTLKDDIRRLVARHGGVVANVGYGRASMPPATHSEGDHA